MPHLQRILSSDSVDVFESDAQVGSGIEGRKDGVADLTLRFPDKEGKPPQMTPSSAQYSLAKRRNRFLVTSHLIWKHLAEKV